MRSSNTDIRRFQSGDFDAFQRLTKAEGARLLSFIRAQVHTREAAEDIYQEVCSTVWAKRAQLRDPQAFPAWLYQITRRTILREIQRNAWERESRIFPAEDAWPEPPDTRPSQASLLERKELANAIHDAFELLDEQTQSVMLLRFKSNLTLKEISETVNLPLGTVYSRMRGGITRVGRYLASRDLIDRTRVSKER